MGWLYRHWAFVTAGIVPAAWAWYVLASGAAPDHAAALAWALAPVYFLHQVEEHAWPGGFKRFIDDRIFKAGGADLPLDDGDIFWINVPLTWVLFPVAAWLSGTYPALAAGCFAVCLINGVVHTVGALRFGYNPGLISGFTLLIPFGIAGYLALAPALGAIGILIAWAIGVGIHVLLIVYALAKYRRYRSQTASAAS